MTKASNFRTINESFLLDLLLNSTNEAIVVVDQNGDIQMLSDAYAEFLEVDKETVLGKHVTQVIENTRMHQVLITKKPEIAQVQEIKGHNMIATRFPIIRDVEVIGAFGRVLFKDLTELRNLYGRINNMEQELLLYKSKYGQINTAKYTVDDLIGQSPVMKNLKDTVIRIAKGQSNVLILGESGTGKELFAHAIHSASIRRHNPFICLNCGSIPENLLESELFGYVEGSFTGAKKGGKPGIFHMAHRGTLFLDEIGDLPLHMQVKLLRVLQDKEVQKIGSHKKEEIDVRIIAATNRNLYQMVEEESFRSDLFYRLNVINFQIPPLRERIEDIPLLVDFLLDKISLKQGVRVRGLSKKAMERLKSYSWPGNVRELENILERAINFVEDNGEIHFRHLENKIVERDVSVYSGSLKEMMENMERETIVRALSYNKGRKTATAKSLGISRTTLYEKMEKYGI